MNEYEVISPEFVDIVAGDISFLSALFYPVLAGGWSGFFASLALIPALLIGLNFSDKIKNANNELIDANPTSISNPIILKIFGFLFFILVVINFFSAVRELVQFYNLSYFTKYCLIFFMIVGRIELLTILLLVKKFLFKN